jgi:hypothetical protein
LVVDFFGVEGFLDKVDGLKLGKSFAAKNI